jgi:hypothetical protein
VLAHELDLVFHAHEDTAEVDRHEAVPLVLADLGGRLDRLLDAGVVEGDVRRPNRSTAACSAALMSSPRMTSQVTARDWPPACSIMRAVSWLPSAAMSDLPVEAAAHGVERETVTVTSRLLSASASMSESMRPSLTRPGEQSKSS